MNEWMDEHKKQCQKWRHYAFRWHFTVFLFLPQFFCLDSSDNFYSTLHFISSFIPSFIVYAIRHEVSNSLLDSFFFLSFFQFLLLFILYVQRFVQYFFFVCNVFSFSDTFRMLSASVTQYWWQICILVVVRPNSILSGNCYYCRQFQYGIALYFVIFG